MPARPSAWLGHVPFAVWLVEAMRPASFVELGAHFGHSYFAVCSAVLANRLPTRCYAVDTWEGDTHAGHYGEEIYAEVNQRNRTHYGGFSRLLRMRFDEAVGHFADGSIDLLHIDGWHTYEAVRNDYETWRGKLSDRGIVLFHDINVRDRDFGVWKFWDEVRLTHPSFEFQHSHGLGVLLVGKDQPASLAALAATPDGDPQRAWVKALFSRLGRTLELDAELRAVVTQLQEASARAHNSELARLQDAATMKAEREAATHAAGRITELERLVGDLNRSRDALLGSTWWRLGAPVRSGLEKLRGRDQRAG